MGTTAATPPLYTANSDAFMVQLRGTRPKDGDAAMAEAVTIELPEEITRQARAIARRTGRLMEDILTDWLRQGAVSDGSIRLPDSEYPLYTPYGNESVAQGLLDALHAEETKASTDELRR
jgi:hypothetical protein